MLEAIGVPEYLYHYTTVESLAMILKSRKIRLGPLTDMDDLQESKCDENYNFARFVFVSAWTEDGVESIPMWNMYAKMDRGVRIRLSGNPIADFEITREALALIGKIEGEFNPPFRVICPSEELYSAPYFPVPYVKENILQKVVYTNDIELLKPRILNKTETNGVSLKIGELGKYKSKSWDFQKEWRFKVWINPVGFKDMTELNVEAVNMVLKRMTDDLLPLPIKEFFCLCVSRRRES